ncbi:PDZ domain-containing protein [Sulfurospirillum oryzae]|uniref:PDZ domain-containing protein n=1 Tax=Sulfurospirillum oryzae TaxID=2976535 RepID=UPI0021E77B95|nr:PDZ domain-containing protein [Sulfurospirillum oryzae]
MKRLGLFLLLITQVLFSADAPVPASKAEFVYPDFSQCYEKNRQSVVYFGKTRAVAISEKQAIAYSKEKPSVPYVRYDYFSNLYLFDSPKPLIPMKLKATSELKMGEWLASMTDNSLVAVNASKMGNGANDFFEFGGVGEVNSIVGGLCCEMYGLGIGDKFFIGSEALGRFIEGKSASFQELGVRVVDGNESVVVDFVDPNFKDAKLKAGDKITLLNGKKVSNVTEFADALKTFQDLTKVSAQIQRDNAWIEENILAPKPVKKVEPKKAHVPEVKKESYLQMKGFKFDNDLRIKEIARNSFAEQSGLKVGDRLMQVDELPVQRVQEADAYMAKARNKEMSLLFDREDFQFFVTLNR